MAHEKLNTEVIQEMYWGSVFCCPPCAVFTEETLYRVHEGGKSVGEIKEESTFACRMCLEPMMRELDSKIEIDG